MEMTDHFSQKKLKILTPEELPKLRSTIGRDGHEEYYAMYSSVWDGIVVDPAFMMIPIDDHMVHRGDGVFEAFKCVNGNLYNVRRHLKRLKYSAEAVGIEPPFSLDDILEIVIETIRVSQQKECLVRLFVSRGPGGFTTNPYECVRSQLYVVITSLSRPPLSKYEKGVTMSVSKIPIKPSFFANIKSCNYLPNVLMKKEAVDSGVDFVLSLDENGFLCESSTENVGVLTSEGVLLFPRFDRILRGTTVTRAYELAHRLVPQGTISSVDFADISLDMAYACKEMMTFGTTFDILPIVDFNAHVIGSGEPGPVYKELYKLLRQDMTGNPEFLAAVFH